jgi:hypothetical protein
LSYQIYGLLYHIGFISARRFQFIQAPGEDKSRLRIHFGGYFSLFIEPLVDVKRHADIAKLLDILHVNPSTGMIGRIGDRYAMLKVLRLYACQLL